MVSASASGPNPHSNPASLCPPPGAGSTDGQDLPCHAMRARASEASQHQSDRAHKLSAYHYFRIARSLSDCVLLALTEHVHGPHAVGLGELVEIARIMETAHAKARQEQERRSISPRRPKVYPPPVLPLPAHVSQSESTGLIARALPAEARRIRFITHALRGAAKAAASRTHQYCEPLPAPTACSGPELVCAQRNLFAPSRHRDCLSARCGRATRREARGANGRLEAKTRPPPAENAAVHSHTANNNNSFGAAAISFTSSRGW